MKGEQSEQFGSLAPSLSEIALDGVGAVAVAGGVAIRQTQESACSQETAGQHEEAEEFQVGRFAQLFNTTEQLSQGERKGVRRIKNMQYCNRSFVSLDASLQLL